MDNISYSLDGSRRWHDVMRNNVETRHHDDVGFEISVHNSFYNQIQQNSAIFGIVLSVWTVIVNALVIYCLLRDRHIRCDAFYIQIINFSVSNLLIGTTVIPLTVYYILYPWALGHVMCIVWVVLDVLLPFVSLAILTTMNFDRLLVLTHPNVYKCIFQNCLPTLVVLLPWLLPFLIVYPLWTAGAMPYTNQPGECFVYVTFEAAILCPILTYFCPLLLVISLTLQILVYRMKHEQTLHNISSSELEELSVKSAEDTTSSQRVTELKDIAIGERAEKINRIIGETSNSIILIFVVNFLFTLMWLPFQCISLIIPACAPSICAPRFQVSEIITWTGAASSGVVPIAWFIDKNLRKSLRATFRKRKNKQLDVIAEPSVEETCL